MIALLRSRQTAIWLLLVLATCLSWEVVQDIGWPKDARTSGVAVLVIAFAKARLILLDFMELRSAAWPMRLAAEGWSIILCAALILIYWLRG